MATDTDATTRTGAGVGVGPDPVARPHAAGSSTYGSQSGPHSSDPFAHDPRAGSVAATPPVTGLFRNLVDDLGKLVSMEIKLARVEVGESVSRLKGGIGAIAVGGAVLFAGSLVLLGALVLFVAQFMALWLATLVVGAVVTLIGFVMLASGKKRFEAAAFVPERTLDSLQKDQEMVRRKL